MGGVSRPIGGGVSSVVGISGGAVEVVLVDVVVTVSMSFVKPCLIRCASEIIVVSRVLVCSAFCREASWDIFDSSMWVCSSALWSEMACVCWSRGIISCVC